MVCHCSICFSLVVEEGENLLSLGNHQQEQEKEEEEEEEGQQQADNSETPSAYHGTCSHYFDPVSSGKEGE